jgi:DNA-binding NarL/FixJ family response regulator
MPRASTWKKANGARRPRIIVADDHVRVLESIAGLLADDFDVVAAVTDGRQAVDAALQLEPDAVLLDITMPILDGVRAAQELRRIASRAKVVFLTMHDTDEYVVAAIEAGGHAYVLKTRIHTDLLNALDHALSDRLFLPSLTPLSTVANTGAAHTHAVQFRPSDRVPPAGVGRWLGASLQRGDLAAIVVTTAMHSGILQQLDAAGCDVADARRQRRWLVFDAEEALSQCMRNGRPDAGEVATFIEALERSRQAMAGAASRLSIFGEMSVLLLQDGNREGALQLERLWNELTHGLPFLTVCSYPEECFGPTGHAEILPQLYAEHSAVCHAPAA